MLFRLKIFFLKTLINFIAYLLTDGVRYFEHNPTYVLSFYCNELDRQQLNQVCW
jgi:hypothetical protein